MNIFRVHILVIIKSILLLIVMNYLVYCKSQALLEPYDEDAFIRAKETLFLCVPFLYIETHISYTEYFKHYAAASHASQAFTRLIYSTMKKKQIL